MKSKLVFLILILFIFISDFCKAQELPERAKSIKLLWEGSTKDSIGYEQLEIGLNLLYIYNEEGLQNTDLYKTVFKDVKYGIIGVYLEEPEGGSLSTFYQIIRFDEIAKEERIGIDALERYISTEVKNKKAEHNNSLNTLFEIDNWGTVTQMEGKTILYKTILKSTSPTKGFVIEFDNSYLPTALYVFDNYGIIDQYEYMGSRYVRTKARKIFSYTIDDRKTNFYTLYNPQIKGSQIVPVVKHKDDMAVAIRLNEKLQLTECKKIVIDKTKYDHIDNNTSIHSFSLNKDIIAPTTTDIQTNFFKEISQDQINGLNETLKSRGVSETFCSVITNNLLVQGNNIVLLDNTIFSWTGNNLKKGSYSVIGVNKWESGAEKLYLATYEMKKLNKVELSDGTVYDRFKDGFFFSTNTITDPNRSFVAVYKNDGTISSSALFLNDNGFRVDYSSNSIQNNLDLINAPLFSAYSKIPSGYGDQKHIIEKITNNEYVMGNIYEIACPKKGYRLIDMKSGDSLLLLSITGNVVNDLSKENHEGIVHFSDETEVVTYKLPQYGTSEPTIVNAERILTKHEGVLETNNDGTFKLKVTSSDCFGRILRSWEMFYE